MDYLTQRDQLAQEARSLATASYNDQPSKTLQGPAAEADINNIVRAYGHGFPVPPEIFDPRYYGEVSDDLTLTQALDQIHDARDKFMALPAMLRKEFNNDPLELHEFMQDENNWPEAERLGLIKRWPQPAPESVPQDANPST